jgi:hypothetical protein
MLNLLQILTPYSFLKLFIFDSCRRYKLVQFFTEDKLDKIFGISSKESCVIIY